MDMVREIPMPFGTLVFRHPENKPDAVVARWNAAGYHLYLSQSGGLLEAALKKPRTEAHVNNVEMTEGFVPRQEESISDDESMISDNTQADNGNTSRNLKPREEDSTDENSFSVAKDCWWLQRQYNEELTEEEDDEFLDEISGPTIHGTTTSDMPHACGICGRPFRRKKDIRRHLSTHSNEKPFACMACPLTFRSRDYLSRHCRRVHGIPRFAYDFAGTGDGTSDKRLIAKLGCRQRRKARSPGEDVSDDTEAEDQEPLPASQEDGDDSGARRAPGRSEPPADEAQVQCGVCSGLMARAEVMVMLPKPSVLAPNDGKPRIVCKPCFAKNTGLLCIG